MLGKDIEEKPTRAQSQFLAHDADLIRFNVNERTMTHKYAEHLQKEFPDWDVDCEYNRIGQAVKKLRSKLKEVSPDDLDARTVYPDIIVHRRGQQDNL